MNEKKTDKIIKEENKLAFYKKISETKPISKETDKTIDSTFIIKLINS